MNRRATNCCKRIAIMAGKPDTNLTRRSFIQALTTVSVLALVARHQLASAPGDQIVEIDGWILRRSDLA